MRPYLLVDFGSTYTKLTCVDLENEYIIGTSKAPTTVESDVLDGYERAFKYLISDHPEIKKISGISACSSAAGGLKMAAIGLVEELTVEAAKRACLGAGAIVTYENPILISYYSPVVPMVETKNASFITPKNLLMSISTYL